jgi:thiol-disulfide isomerase/thioredoxin
MAYGSQSDVNMVFLVYADWCGPCKAIAPVYESLSTSLSRPNLITFAKVNTDTQREIAAKYTISA